jgi:hypothetical protein
MGDQKSLSQGSPQIPSKHPLRQFSKRVDPARESGLLSVEELTDAQKRALAGVNSVVQTLAAKHPEKKLSTRFSFLPRIRQETFNAVFLIDGARGSGKTAVLLQILEYWNRQARMLLSGTDSREVSSSDGDDRFKEVSSFISSEQARNFVLPVGLIELQPLPGSALILPYIATLFRRLVSEIEEGRFAYQSQDDDTVPKRERWRRFRELQPKSKERWSRLMTAAASWTNSFLKRAPSLDNEAYVMELEEQGLNSLDIRPSFEAFIDALVEDFQAEFNLDQPPYFVVAIDDADMNAEKSVELLHTVRTLRHSRVGYVLTGHSTLFLDMLRDHHLAALRSPLRDYAIGHKERFDLTSSVRAAQLAQDVFDKAIPERHRFMLTAREPERRLEAVRQTLALVEVALERPLLRYLQLDSVSPRAAGDKPEQTPDSASPEAEWNRRTIFALPSRVRGLRDLEDFVEHQWRRLVDLMLLRPAQSGSATTRTNAVPPTQGGDDATAHEPDPVDSYVADGAERKSGDTKKSTKNPTQTFPSSPTALPADQRATIGYALAALVVRKLWVDRISTSEIDRALHEPLRKNVRIENDRDGSFIVENTDIRSVALYRQYPEVQIAVELPNGRAGVLRANELFGYELTYRPSAEAVLLPPAVASAFILATDVAADSPYGEFQGQSRSPGAAGSLFVTAEFTTSNNIIVEFFWPLPDWDSYRDFDHFAFEWKTRIAGVGDAETLVNEYLWLALDIIRLSFERTHASATEPWEKEFTETGTRSLAKAIEGVRALKEALSGLRSSWNSAEREAYTWIEAGLRSLFWVESGLPDNVNEALAQLFVLTSANSEDSITDSRNRRNRHASDTWEGDVPNARVRMGKERGTPVHEADWYKDFEPSRVSESSSNREYYSFAVDASQPRGPKAGWREAFLWVYNDIFGSDEGSRPVSRSSAARSRGSSGKRIPVRGSTSQGTAVRKASRRKQSSRSR